MSKQSIKLRERVEEFLNKKPAAVKKIPPQEIRNLFEDLKIYQMELEKKNDDLQKTHKQIQESEKNSGVCLKAIVPSCILLILSKN